MTAPYGELCGVWMTGHILVFNLRRSDFDSKSCGLKKVALSDQYGLELYDKLKKKQTTSCCITHYCLFLYIMLSHEIIFHPHAHNLHYKCILSFSM